MLRSWKGLSKSLRGRVYLCIINATSNKNLFDNCIYFVYTLDMKVIINIKTEKEVKENAQKLAKELGLSLSDVLNASLRNFIRTREVYFSHTPRMTKELEDVIEEAERDKTLKRNFSPEFNSAQEATDYLNNL